MVTKADGSARKGMVREIGIISWILKYILISICYTVYRSHVNTLEPQNR